MAALALLVVAILGPCIVGVFLVKSSDQKRRDRDRRTFRLYFPNELDEAAITAWIRSISGTLRISSAKVTGVPSIAFELWATNEGMIHRLKVPWQQSDYVLAQLRSQMPGIQAVPEEDWLAHEWTRAVEVGLTNSSRPLRILSAADVSTSILASVQALEQDEAVVMQWVVTPALPRHLPVYKEATSDMFTYRHLLHGSVANRDEVNARREKLSEPNVLAVLRIAAKASTPIRADHLIFQVRAALAAVRSPSSRFKKRLVTKDELSRRIEAGAGLVNSPIQLSAPELAALVAWPIGSPFVAGLPQALGRQFPAHGAVPTQGIVVGDSPIVGNSTNRNSKGRPVAIGFKEALMHTWVGGGTGVGKSELLAHMGRQIIETGLGLIVMETEGNLYQKVLDYVPKDRIDDVVLMDVSDGRNPVGFNILDQGNPATVIDEIMDLFRHKFGKEGMGIWSQKYIYHGLRTIAEHPDLTFVDIVTLLNPMTSDEVIWVDNVARAVKDPDLRRWWQRHDNRGKIEQQKRADPVLSRVWQLASRPELRYILGQSKSTFQMQDILAQNKILLINLKGVSRETASLMGTLLMNAIWHATKNVTKDKPTYLLLDEFADFMDLPIDTESMLAQARKHGLGMVLANQHLTQLSTGMRDAIITNARNEIMFQGNADDGSTLARHMANKINSGDIVNLRTYEAIASIQTPAGNSGPVSINTRPPGKVTGVSAQVRAHSQKTCGRPVNDVYREMVKRFEQPEKRNKRPRPKISGLDD